MSTNWQNDPRIDCKPHSHLVEVIESNLKFEKFEGFFEQNELVDIENVGIIYLFYILFIFYDL